jgi:hypothetical protein
MHERFSPSTITDMTNTPEGLLVEFEHGRTFLYQAGFLWEARDNEGAAPLEIACERHALSHDMN